MTNKDFPGRYPYRDSGLKYWEATHTWVKDYLDVSLGLQYTLKLARKDSRCSRAVSRQEFITRHGPVDAASQRANFRPQVGCRSQLIISGLADLDQASQSSQSNPPRTGGPGPEKHERFSAFHKPCYKCGKPIIRIVGTTGKRLILSPTNNY